MWLAKVIFVTAMQLETLTWCYGPLDVLANQYVILGENGAYKYGYRTGDGTEASQEADGNNQVFGHYFYRDDLGNFGVKYTAGVQGYAPETLGPNGFHLGVADIKLPINHLKAYRFSFDTGKYRKEESSDSNGNIRGHFEYTDNAGLHDLSYVANDQTGFKVTGGSLATPEQYFGERTPQPFVPYPGAPQTNTPSPRLTSSFDGQIPLISVRRSAYYPHTDLSYHFCFDAGNYKKEEWSDEKGNIRGYFEFVDEDGVHNLRYIANDEAGFQVTGGNLAQNYPHYLPPSVGSANGAPMEKPNGKDDDEIIFVVGKTTMKPEVME